MKGRRSIKLTKFKELQNQLFSANGNIRYLLERLDEAERALVDISDCLLPHELTGSGMSQGRVEEIDKIVAYKKARMQMEQLGQI